MCNHFILSEFPQFCYIYPWNSFLYIIFNSSFFQSRIQNPLKHLRRSILRKAINYFCTICNYFYLSVFLRCLRGYWIGLCLLLYSHSRLDFRCWRFFQDWIGKACSILWSASICISISRKRKTKKILFIGNKFGFPYVDI